MILTELRRKKLDHPFVAMPGDKVELLLTEDNQIKVILSVEIKKQRVFDEAVLYEMTRGADGRTGIGGFFLDKEE